MLNNARLPGSARVYTAENMMKSIPPFKAQYSLPLTRAIAMCKHMAAVLMLLQCCSYLRGEEGRMRVQR